MFKLLAHFYRLDTRDLSLGTASWMLRVSILAELHPRAKRARVRSPIAKEMW